MPFFLIGVFLRPLKGRLNSLHNYYVEVLLLAVAVAAVVLSAEYNGYVWMYLNGIGRNYALFIVGGVAGAAMLYVVSLWLGRLPYRSMVERLSKGSIAHHRGAPAHGTARPPVGGGPAVLRAPPAVLRALGPTGRTVLSHTVGSEEITPPRVFYFSCKNATLATRAVSQQLTRGIMVASVARKPIF